ncbi:hypothetical protein HYH02_011450 [Chlamydomonas schloesseri]|uniref:Sec39 domain-containing protein n=1 Tax=Chlamydomonas schloesseri TaxID=2026947 RepID=A0A835T1B2_9CHLO|nr:hypothetical protein HYH02_011450 [Chlamydomonas schloesseri]|eukprot:KAG2437019.1 hypothetical protein HYH02_011450 [Chlamydomonas schloesseri]
MLPPKSGPWHGREVSAVALPAPSLLLLLTSKPPQLFAVPLGAPPRVLAALKPTPLGGRAGHASIRAAAFHAATAMLVLAGEAGRSGGEPCPTVSVSAWQLEISGSGGVCKAQFKGSYAGPINAPEAGDAAKGAGSVRLTGLGRWCLAMSPLGEQVALCVPLPAGGGLLLLSLPQCSRMQLGAQAAPGLTACAASAVSACWWRSETVLALADGHGRVALAQLPGLGVDLLLSGSSLGGVDAKEGGQEEGAGPLQGVTFAPGSVVAAKVGGPGPRGLLVLEPVATPAAAGGGGRLGGAPVVSLRLLLLAERTAQEMMSLHLRHQRWGAALRLAAAEGLDADPVYAARWAASALDGGGEAVTTNLEHVRDRRWVVGQCLTRLAVDAAGQRLLLRYGLAESEAQSDGGGRTGDGGDGPWWWWRLARLRLLRHLDRLEVLLAAQGGVYDAAAYAAFRDLPLAAAAGSWAALGGVGPLTALAAAYPAALSPSAPGPLMLGVLSRLPETLSPRLYGALLPRVDSTDTAAARPPPRAMDWAEAPEQLAALAAALTAVNQEAGGPGLGGEEEAPGGGPLPQGGADLADLTDATWRALAPPHLRLSAAAVCEWYCERALQLDEATGQMQAALVLLELGWERGGRSPRLAQLLGASRALAGCMTTASTARQCTTAAAAPPGHGRHGHPRPPPPSVWLLGLRGFLGLPGGEQLRLLLGGSSEDSLRRDVKERVVPFLRGPGVSAADAAALAGALLCEELQRRPGWVATLCEAEADAMAATSASEAMLFGSALQMAKALHRALMDCHHTDEWPALQRAVAAAGRALAAERRRQEVTAAPGAGARHAGHEGGTHAEQPQLVEAEEELSRLAGAVAAAELLWGHGLPLTVRHVSICREGGHEAARCVRQVLGRVQRSSASQPDAQWAVLWRDLAKVRAAAFTCLAPEQVLSELCRCMLHCGRTDLANAYLRGGAPRVRIEWTVAARNFSSQVGGGEAHEDEDADADERPAVMVSLMDEAADSLLASVAAELLAAANDPWDSWAQQAAACLALVGDECAAAQGLRRLMAALELLPDFGIELLPAQVLQMPDRLEVVRLALAAEEQAQAERSGGAAAGLAPGLVAVLTGSGKAATARAGARGLDAAAVGGRTSRRRAAVQVAGRAAAAGGRAAAALAGGLLAVAGRVAPNVAGAVAVAGGAVADRMAGIVAAAAGEVVSTDAAETAAADAGRRSGSLGRLLELAELLGLTSTADEFKVRELAARSALRSGDVSTAQHLALGLMAAAQHTDIWSLCADLGSHKQLPGGDGVRQRLLSYAVLHCAPARMPLLLEELREVERRLDPLVHPHADQLEQPGTTDTDTQLLRQAVVVTPLAGLSASSGLPSLGDSLLALAMLQPLVAARGGTTGPEASARLQLLIGLAAAQDGPDGQHGAPYAQVQRALALQCFCHCLVAIAAGGGCTTPQQRQQLLQRPLGDVLIEVRRSSSSGAAVVTAAAAAALTAESALAAAADSRAVRRAVPGVDAGQFASGDVKYRREAIIRQASLAGAAEAEALVGSAPGGSSPSSASGPPSPTSGASASRPSAPDPGSVPPQTGPPSSLPEDLADAATSARGYELLAAAARLAAAYGVEGWELRLAFTTALLTSAPAVTPELRSAVSRAAAPLLTSERLITALLRQLAFTAYPALPPAGGTHLAAWVALFVEGLGAAAQLPLATGDPDAAALPALASAACPTLDKLRELLERAAGALKGLALTTLLAPLLGAVLQPLGLELRPPTAAAAAAAGSPAASAAAAALFAYVKPTNIAQAAKLVAALHKLLGPLARKAPLPQLQPALDALPPSLPYLCLCVKAVSGKVLQQRGSGDSGTVTAPPLPQRDMAAAWGHIAEHVMRLPPPELVAWLAFALLPASGPGPEYRCPLPTAVTGCPLQPVPMLRPLQTEVLGVCMPLLANADLGQAASMGYAPQLLQLRELSRRLRMLQTATNDMQTLSREQVGQIEIELCGGSGTHAVDLSDTGGVQTALAHLAASGCPFTFLVGLAEAAHEDAQDSRGASAMALAAAAVTEAVQLFTANSGGTGASGELALEQLRGVVRCLDLQLHDYHATQLAGGDVAEVVSALREELWTGMQQVAEQLDAGESSSRIAGFLGLQASLGSEFWADWGDKAASADGRTEQLRLRLLFTRTRALLAQLPPRHPVPPARVGLLPEDLDSLEAAEQLFVRLLGAPDGNMWSALPPDQALQSLQLLARLLMEVWKNGHIWSPVPCCEQDSMAETKPLSPLHGCWRALALAHLWSGHLVQLARLLDSAPDAELLLAEADVGDLLQNCPGPWSRWVVGMSSPYQVHQQKALAELQQHVSPGASLPAATELEALLLLALLVRNRGTRLSEPCLDVILKQLPATAPAQAHADDASAACSAIARSALVPVLASVLVESGQAGLAAALAARWLRLHPSLAGASGSGIVLEAFLRKAGADPGIPGFIPDDDWPSCVVWAVHSREALCRGALQQLAQAASTSKVAES